MFLLRASALLRRVGVRYGTVYPEHAKKKAISMIVEGCVVGTVFAIWWRISHNSYKATVNDYYINLRAEKAEEEE
eukprot:CAMPEP_0119362160 /NCGR_PEP_ID=MMETSP1334-20130426/9296_1 /TAXON_ID=127549 /ORGANISM="Calcidiscus leptoporus, Strain RCC1130" /LENGTH=74 /DNA_ID=CAMNT_0007377335 /DNA_START=21 /DNA_END=245 /DNA_ORIENTATION=+